MNKSVKLNEAELKKFIRKVVKEATAGYATSFKVPQSSKGTSVYPSQEALKTDMENFQTKFNEALGFDLDIEDNPYKECLELLKSIESDPTLKDASGHKLVKLLSSKVHTFVQKRNELIKDFKTFLHNKETANLLLSLPNIISSGNEDLIKKEIGKK